MIRLRPRSAPRMLLCLLWAAGICIGFHEAAAYSNTAADVLAQPDRWRAGSQKAASDVRLADHRATLLVTLHPHCPCSRATLDELARLLAQTPEPPHVEILVYQPEATPESWIETGITAQARAIPGVSVRPDPKGRQSERFGLSVSGQTALYSPTGRLLFSGGITLARGHAGDNAGRAAIVSLLAHGHSTTSRTPVFGCSILDRR